MHRKPARKPESEEISRREAMKSLGAVTASARLAALPVAILAISGRKNWILTEEDLSAS